MKKVILGSMVAVACTCALAANAARAALICDGSTKTGATSGAVKEGSFVKVPFSAKCSANVLLDGVDQSSTVYAVGSGSAKGKKYFAGNTAGGAVKAVGDCDVKTGCAKEDAAKGSAQGVKDAEST